MYMEIARRLHMPVFGIGLPRHFVLEFNDGNFATYIDPFHGGRTITAQECFALAGAKVADPLLLQRSTPKQIAMRMLQNLHGVYLRAQDSEKAIVTLDLLLTGAPETGAWYKRRGMLSLELRRFHNARRDLLKYLELEPEATDREAIQKQLQAIHLWLARVS
jgi:regulator of sirC expression with transglutaminase-like and TPR domain